MVRDARPFEVVAFAAVAALVAAAFYGSQYQMMIALLATVAVIFSAAVLRPDRDGITVSIALTVFGIVWIGLPFAPVSARLPGHGASLLVDVLVATFVAMPRPPATLFGRLGSRRLSRRTRPSGFRPGSSAARSASGSPGSTRTGCPASRPADGMCIALLAPVGDLFSRCSSATCRSRPGDLRPARRAAR
jgi:hypothetical protein